MTLPRYPDFVPISLELKDILQPVLAKAADGVSEYTFANLYLFRERYDYKVCCDTSVQTDDDVLIVCGTREGKRFFETPCGLPSDVALHNLIEQTDYWKCIPESIMQNNPSLAADFNITISEDRDNFDYLYLRSDLALLSGKKFHKKRNLVNAFLLSYPDHCVAPLTKENVKHAIAVLDQWRIDKGGDGDYAASLQALELFEELGLQGEVCFIRGKPAGYSLGEPLANGTMFGLHFEKGIDEYKGIYQFINQSFAAALSESYTYINREQDLGDEGLRQAKMTYRPCGFVKKWIGSKLK